MTDLERIDYVQALDILISTGVTEDFADYHADPDQDGTNGNTGTGTTAIHGVEDFLPWHRQFIWEFEKELQSINANLTIPYWDWTGTSDPSGVDSQSKQGPLWENATSPEINAAGWSGNFLGKYNGSLSLNRLSTAPTNPSLSLPVQGLVQHTLGLTSFTDFRNFLESPVHGPPHGWVGGIMANGLIAPRDPVFYFHHSMVDKIWQDWTNLGNTSTFVGDGFNAGNVMYTFSNNPNTPFPATNPNNITDSRTLGIFYSDAVAQQTTLEQYTVANNTLPTEKFVYQYLIVAENDFIVPNGGDAELRSCEKIVLDGDFRVQLGGAFFAVVDDDCNFGTAALVAAPTQEERIQRPKTDYRPWRMVRAYPNPVAGTALQLDFTLEQAAAVSLEVINPFGQVLQRPLTSERLAAGAHTYTLDGLPVSPGIYYLVLRTDSGVTESFRMVKTE